MAARSALRGVEPRAQREERARPVAPSASREAAADRTRAGPPGAGARAVETRTAHRVLARVCTGTAARRSHRSVCFGSFRRRCTMPIKHSAATHVSVHLRGEGRALTLTVIDNGVGFNVDDVRTGPRPREHERTARAHRRARRDSISAGIRDPGRGRGARASSCVTSRAPCGRKSRLRSLFAPSTHCSPVSL